MARIIVAVIMILVAMWLLSGCSTMREYGIGGEPKLACIEQKAYIDDRLFGSTLGWLTWMRPFKAVNALCLARDAAAHSQEAGSMAQDGDQSGDH